MPDRDHHKSRKKKFTIVLVPDEEAIKIIDTLPRSPTEAASTTVLYRVLVHPDAPDGVHNLGFRYSVNGIISVRLRFLIQEIMQS